MDMIGHYNKCIQNGLIKMVRYMQPNLLCDQTRRQQISGPRQNLTKITFPVLCANGNKIGGCCFFELYSIQGEVIAAGELIRGSVIDVKAIARGVYILKLIRNALTHQIFKIVLD